MRRDGSSPRSDRSARTRDGLIYAFSAYAIWGFLPLYFLVLAPTGPWEVVAWRVLFSLVFCAILITATKAWERIIALLHRRRLMLIMGVAGILIFINWQTYVIATLSGHVVEAALGYFINPIVTIFLGVVVLRERLRPAQWTAVGISLLAVVVISVGYGAVPWISLILAFSFGSYGLAKNRVGRDVDAVSGLTIETLWLAPVAIVELIIVGATTGIVFGTVSVWLTLALLAAGIVTAVPLLLFAGAASRLPLSYMGFVQYLTPILQFVLGVFVLSEPMPFERLAGFALVWIALIILTVDLLAHGRSMRRLRLEPV